MDILQKCEVFQFDPNSLSMNYIVSLYKNLKIKKKNLYST